MCCFVAHWLVVLRVFHNKGEQISLLSSDGQCCKSRVSSDARWLQGAHAGCSEKSISNAYHWSFAQSVLMPGGVAPLPGSAVREEVKTGGRDGKNKTKLRCFRVFTGGWLGWRRCVCLYLKHRGKGTGRWWWPTRHSAQEKVREMWGEEEEEEVVVGRWAGL